MSQKEVIDEFMILSGFKKSKATEIIKQVSEATRTVFEKNGKVSMLNIGKIITSKRKERISVLKGVEYTVPGKTAPKMIFFKKIKEIANKK